MGIMKGFLQAIKEFNSFELEGKLDVEGDAIGWWKNKISK